MHVGVTTSWLLSQVFCRIFAFSNEIGAKKPQRGIVFRSERDQGETKLGTAGLVVRIRGGGRLAGGQWKEEL